MSEVEDAVYCIHCGTKLDDDSVFCPQCGAPVTDSSDSTEANTDPAADEETASNDKASEPDGQKPKKKRTGLIAGVIIGIIVVAGIIVGIVLFMQHNAAEQARRQPHAVPITIVADGYNDQCTKFPIHVTGTDIDESAIDETFFVGLDGQGVSLVKGTYEMAFPASPLTPDGILYNTPTNPVTIVLNDDLEPGATLSEDAVSPIIYPRSTALNETEEMINAASEWAEKDPSQTDRVAGLKDAALKAHNDAVAAEEARKEAERKAAEEEAARQAALKARTIETDYYTFIMPESWVGNVDIYTEAGNCEIRPKGASENMISIIVDYPDIEYGGDIGSGILNTWYLSGGHNIAMLQQNYAGFCMNPQNHDLTVEQANLGARLESGGQVTYDSVQEAMRTEGNPGKPMGTILDWMSDNLPPNLTPK